MGFFSHRQRKGRSLSREELRAEVLRPAMFEILEPRLLLDGNPTAVDDLVALPYLGDSVIISPLDNDTPGEDPLSITGFTDGTCGTVTQDGDTLTYTKNDGDIFLGRDTFTYEIPDGLGGTLTATVTIGSTPRLQNDTYDSLYEDIANNVLDVLTNDADLPLGDALTITDVTGAQHGTTTIGVDGEGTPVIFYTPDADFYGSETLTYTVEDTDGLTSTATATLTVHNTKDAPTANDDTALLNAGATITYINPLSNDTSEPDPTETLTIVPDSFPTETTYATISLDGNTFVYTLKDGVTFPGEDTFTYTIKDPDDLESTATVTIHDRPVATADDFTVVEDSNPTSEDNQFNVLANDIPDGEDFTISATDVTDPAHGTVTVDVDNKTLLYTPNADFFSDDVDDVDTFTYRATDADGHKTDAVTVTVHVTSVNDDPTAVDDTVALDGGAESISFNPMANDEILPDTDETLSITDFTDPTEGAVTQDGDTLTYTPDNPAAFSGHDTFTYTISDGNGGTDTATVTIGSTPTPADDPLITVAEDSADNELDVLDNDTDLPVGGTFTIINESFNAQHGTVTKNAEGTLLYYTPEADYVGTDTFTYTVEDADGLQATATVTVDVTAEQDAPVAADDTAVMDYGQANIDIDVLANDDDADDDELNILSFTQGAHGTVVMNTDGETSYQTFTYTPDGEFTGVDTFTYTLQDPVTLLESTATVTVQMKPEAVDDAPASMDEDTTLTIDVLENDHKHDDNGELAIDSITQGHHGTVELVTDSETGDQTLTYQPNADFFGTDTFTYTIEDELGFESTATVSITVDNVDDATVKIDFDAIDVNINHNSMSFDLNEYFYDIDPFPNDWAGLFAYRFDTSLGSVDVLLYKEATPITVANFQRYADAGDYIQSFIHRSMPDFVVQGGGFTSDDDFSYPETIYTYDPVANEYGIPNTRGTIAMAKLGGNPDSATSQWFFNLVDNTNTLGPSNNGGFTVFGEVLRNGMDVIDAIAALDTHNLESSNPNTVFTNVPLTDSGDLVLFDKICPLSLTYSLANTNPGLVDAQIVDGQLVLEYTPNTSGVAKITITATDANGGTVDSVIDIRVNGDPDLVVSFGQVTLANRPVEGNRGRVQVFVTNQEQYAAIGTMDIQIWLSLDGDVTNGDGNDYLLTTMANRRVRLGAYRTGSYVTNITLPEIVIPGEYTLVAVVDSGEAIPERNEDNNAATYDVQTYGMYAQHVDLRGAITKIWYKNYAMTQGERGYAMIQVTNNGNQTANGVMSIDLYISNSTEIAIDGVQVGGLENIRLVLPVGAFRTYRVAYTINDQIPSDEYWMYAVINPDNTIAENPVANLGDNPSNNNTTDVPYYDPWAYSYDVLVQRPDLRCNIVSTNLSAAPMAGERALAFIRVTNYNSVRAVGQANVQLYLRPKDVQDGSEDISLGGRNFRVRLNGGYSALVRIGFRLPMTTQDAFGDPIPLPEGEYQLVAVVTPISAGLLEDNVENNETVSGSYQVREAFMDLTTRITRRITRYNPSTQNDMFAAIVEVANKGNAAVRTRGVVVKLWADTDNTLHNDPENEYALSERAISLCLAPDRAALVVFKMVLPGLDELPAGNYYLIAEVDANDNVLESTDDNSYNAEDNNTYSIYRGLRIGLPDLTGTFRSISLPTTGTVSGATGRAIVKVTNGGTVRVLARCNITLYASQDGIWDEQDTQIGEVLNYPIRLFPNRSTYVRLPMNLPFELEGDYSIIAVLDSADDIEESNEDNNEVVSTSTYNVQQAQMDLVGTLGAPIVANPALGGAPIRIPVQIRNNGNVALRQRINIDYFLAGDVNQHIGTLENYFLSLNPGQARTVYFNTTLPFVDGDKTYHVEATIDAANNVYEGLPEDLGETNNHIASALNYQVNEAFVALNGTLQAPLVANPATGNDNLKASMQIRNNGNVRFTGQVNIEFQTSTGVFLGAKNVALNLIPGRAVNVTHTMALPDTLAAGTYDVVAVVTETPKDDIVTTAVNNTAGQGALSVGTPNLTAAILGQPLTGDVATNTAHSAEVQVTNSGNVRSQGRADVQLWATSDGVIDGTGDYLLTTLPDQTFNFQPGLSSTHTLDFALPDGMDKTTYQLATVITRTEGLASEITGDNTSVAPPTFDVVDGWVDLTVTAEWHHGIYGGDDNPSTPENIFLRGHQYAMTVSVTNHGNVAANNFDTQLQALRYYDQDLEKWVTNNPPFELGNLAITSLAAGETFTGTLWFTFPMTLPKTQTYQVSITTDATGNVLETNEGNNRIAEYPLYFAV